MSGTNASDDGISMAVARLREIAAASGDALMSEGAVNPDHRLLGMCAEIASRRKAAATADQRYQEAFLPRFRRTPADEAAEAARQAECKKATAALTHLLREVAKLRATTGAGS